MPVVGDGRSIDRPLPAGLSPAVTEITGSPARRHKPLIAFMTTAWVTRNTCSSHRMRNLALCGTAVLVLSAGQPSVPASIGPTSLAPSAESGAVPDGTQVATTKAVELKVEGVTTAGEIGGRKARSGYEFVIVATSWKNVIPLKPVEKNADRSPVSGMSGFGTSKPKADPANVTMEPTPYVVPMLRKQIWLFTDERFADTVDLEAQAATPGALEDGFGVARLGEVVRGKLVFEAPSGSHYRALQFYDNDNGHALIPLGGSNPAPPPVIGGARQNSLLTLAISEAGFPQAGTAPAGQRLFVVGLRGISRSPRDIVELELDKYVFAQTDQGCVSSPESGDKGLTRPFGEKASFLPTSPNEGQIAFLVPEGTKNIRVLIAPSQVGTIALSAGADFTPSWPTPQQTIQDGSTVRVHVLPSPARPSNLPALGGGREYVLLDVVLENLKPDQGIDFQATQQLRLMDGSGGFIEPSSLSNQLACHLGEQGVVPAGNARRFTLVYDVPAGASRRLQYRGFEKDEVIVEIKR